VPLEQASLRVPPEARADFLTRAERVLALARAREASRTELELALAVLSVLCGACVASPPSDAS